MKQLKAGTELEGYLEQEVGIPNPVQLECRVAQACSGVKGDFLGNKSWEYLQFTVFGCSELEKMLVDTSSRP